MWSAITDWAKMATVVVVVMMIPRTERIRIITVSVQTQRSTDGTRIRLRR